MMLALALLAAICAPSIGLAAADACILPSLAFAPPALSTHLRQNPSFGQKRPQAAAAEKSALQRPATLGQLRRADVVKLRAQKLPRGLQERIVNIHGEEFKVVEVEKTADLVDAWIQQQMATTDPFGVVLWPGAQVLAGELFLLGSALKDKDVLELGAGTGLCSLVAARQGARAVASDTNDQALDLVDISAERAGLKVETAIVDITGSAPLPPSDFLVAADCMYNPAVARALARRVVTALAAGTTPLVADSVNIAREDFEAELVLLKCPYTIEPRNLTFTGSAVGVDMDVVREAKIALFHFDREAASS